MNSSNVTVKPASTLHKAVLTTLIAVAFFLNFVCITFTGRIAYRKPRWPNVLLVHIGVLDLCAVLMVLLPMTIALYIPDTLGHVHFCRYQGAVLNVWYILEFGLLVQIMFDRYFAITHPFVYSKRILESNALFWSNSVFVGVTIITTLIANLAVATNIEFVVVGPGLCFWDISEDNALLISTVNVTISLVILVVLVFLTGGIGVGVFNILRRTHVGDADNVSKGANKTEVNFVKLAIVTSLVFGASSIPFIVSATVLHYCSEPSNDYFGHIGFSKYVWEIIVLSDILKLYWGRVECDLCNNLGTLHVL